CGADPFDDELVRLVGQVDGVRGRVRSGVGDAGRAVADFVDRGREELQLLLVGQGRRLAGRPGDDDAVGAVFDQVARQAAEAFEVDGAVRVERRQHRGEDLSQHAPSLLGVENVLVREAGLQDAAEVARLLGQLGYPTDAGTVERRLDELLASPADDLLVAELGGRVVGYAGLHVSLALERDGPAGKLSGIVVDADVRSLGIGRRLVEAIEAEARRRGCVLLFLTTAQRPCGAHAFYLAPGV